MSPLVWKGYVSQSYRWKGGAELKRNACESYEILDLHFRRVNGFVQDVSLEAIPQVPALFAGKTDAFDRSGGSEHNCSYVNPVEVRSARQAPGLHGWRQNIHLLPAVLFPHWEKA